MQSKNHHPATLFVVLILILLRRLTCPAFQSSSWQLLLLLRHHNAIIIPAVEAFSTPHCITPSPTSSTTARATTSIIMALSKSSSSSQKASNTYGSTASTSVSQKDDKHKDENNNNIIADLLTNLRASMQATHDSGINFEYNWRRTQLLTFRRMMAAYTPQIVDALYQDLHKHPVEATVETTLVVDEIKLTLRHLRQWMKPEKVASPAACMPSWSHVEKRPLLGPACLVIGPSNYPCQLALGPAVGALAAGNPVIIKPSELTPATAAVLEKAVQEYFETGVMRVVNGGVAVTTALLECGSWGKILFTGSERVGRIVVKAAAETLTPVVLELGGKCPAIVDETTPRGHLQVVANRLVWSKIYNAGQSCVAVDYILVHESLKTKLVECLVHSVKLQLGSTDRNNGNNNNNNNDDDYKQSEMGRLATRQHAQRLQDMIREVEEAIPKENGKNNTIGSSTRIHLGSSAACDPSHCQVCPTIIENPPMNSRVWNEEVFGPIVTLRSFATRQEACNIVRGMPGTPLAMSVFTNSDQVLQQYMQQIRAGGVIRNDAMMHVGNAASPFGGIGSSGIGNYHGKYSFDTFSQSLSVMYRPSWPGSDVGMLRYHPLAGVKNWLLSNIVLHLPYVPVLHVRWWFFGLGAIAASLVFAGPLGLPELFQKVVMQFSKQIA